MERRRFLTSAPAVLASVGLGVIAAQPPTAAGADAPLWTKARRGVGLGTQLHDTHEALLRHVDRVDWFRPPRGELSGVALQAAAELGYDVLLWGTEELEALVPGTVAVWHDGLGHRGHLPPGNERREERRRRRLAEIEQLPAAIEAALARGAIFTSVTEGTATSAALS